VLHKVLFFAFLNFVMLTHELMASKTESSSALNAVVKKGLQYSNQGKRDEAKRCFQKAADQGNAIAQHNLGVLFSERKTTSLTSGLPRLGL
jgi:Tfp pilus assembly protein PilF